MSEGLYIEWEWNDQTKRWEDRMNPKDIERAENEALNHSSGGEIVTRPKHYTTGNIETWDFIVDKKLNYLRGNVVKYIVRAGEKDKATELQDLQKARAYIEREIQRVRG